VADNADDRYPDEHDRGEGEGDDDLAGDGCSCRGPSQEVGEQNKHEQSKDEREEFAPTMPDIGVDHIGDKLVADLGERLPPAGNERALACAENEECGDQHDDDRHQQGRIGVRNVEPADMDWNQPMDLELVEWLDFDRQFNSPRRPIVLNRRRSPGACDSPLPR